VSFGTLVQSFPVTPERFRRLRAVLDRRQPDLTVLLENVHKPHNLSAILRTGDAVGVLDAHAVTPGDTLKTAKKIAQGSGKWVGLTCHPTFPEAADTLKSRGFQIVAAHLGAGVVPYTEADYSRPTAILLGQEKDGVTEEAISRADVLVEIPMVGMVASLNVSVAAALILYEARRQREKAGMYDPDWNRPRLDPERRRTILFEWAYPYFADLCRRRGVAYPELSEDGEIEGELPR
jgi:tRNA (guanosine-2'-O-)-methyltransferase